MGRDEAAQRLRDGDIAFILESPANALGELARIHVSAPFYAGLLVQAEGGEGSGARAMALFEAALEGKGRLQREAAEKLMGPLLEADAAEAQAFLSRLESKGRSAGRVASAQPALRSLRAACLYRLGRHAEINALYAGVGTDADASAFGPWDRAFSLLAGLESDAGESGNSGRAAELADFFLGQGSGAAGRWAFGQAGDSLADWAGAALAGHFAVGRSAYGEALGHFRQALALDEGLFFRHPALLGDLGRAFQFSSAQNEGAELLRLWDKRFQNGEFDGKGLDIPGIRYLILYYAGRIQRQIATQSPAQLRRYAPASDYFAQALDFAPDPLQADACIWYILSMSLQEQPRETAALVARYIPRWGRDDYFADILDRLARYLAANSRWDTLAEVFSLIENRSDGGSVAKYAYILGRARSEGLMVAAPRSAEEYFRIALGRGDASFYYRAMAASQLGENLLPIPAEAPTAGRRSPVQSDDQRSNDLEFLLGFFEYGAANFAYGYVQDDADRFSPEELRALAAAFAGAGLWAPSIRVVSAYAGREGYAMNRQDLELYYPRAFAEPVEAYAEEAGIPRELLFALIRTESAFDPGIRSWAGAVGLTQLMPATALDMAGRVSRRGGPNYAEGGEIDLRDPVANIHLGAAYFRYLMDRTEGPLLALLAYNGGIGRLRRWRNAAPRLPADLFLETIEYDETREYARKVLSAAAAYGYLYYGMTMEAVLADTY